MPTADSALPAPVNLADFEARAAAALPRMVYDYYAGGANDERLLRRAPGAWEAITLRYRVLRDVSRRSLACTILGHRHDWPVLVAPTAFQRMAHPDGELATARAASAARTGMVLSTLATTPMEAVAAATEHPLWFQLYIDRDRGRSAALVRRAEAAGCGALVLTVDTPLLGRRERDLRHGFHVPAHLPVPHLGEVTRETLAGEEAGGSALAATFARHLDSAITWADVAWLRGLTTLPILVKGVVRGDDAVQALAHGADGVVVSNHGGRQLDAAIPTARALPEVAEAMAGRGTLLVDGGIRRGTDVVAALALGAQGVLLGRPILWGLAADGEAGVARVLQLFREEVDLAFALAGVNDVTDITRDLLEPAGMPGRPAGG
jgi:4-hydroxymandelate oxidase